MTTPRIEELVEEFRSVSQRKVGEGFIGDMPYTDYEYYFTEEQIDWLRQALTEAHQAGYADGYKQGKFDAEVTIEYGEPQETLQDNK